MKWFGRDPATITGGVVAVLLALVALAPWSDVWQAAVAALITAAGGVIVAIVVVRDGQLPAILGLFKAGMAIWVLAGWEISDTQQGLVLVAVEAIFGLFVRTQVVAPIDANGNRVAAVPLRRAA